MERAILLLGSNLGDRADYLKRAINFLEREGVEIVKTSSVYESPAFGYESSSTYYNLAIEVGIEVTPDELLEISQSIESELKRKRSTTEKYSDRTIDIDIILIEGKVLNKVHLIVPHPRMHERIFCLKPVNEIAGSWVIGTLNKTVKEVLESLKDINDVNKIDVRV